MSVKAMGRVFSMDMPPNLKLVLLALADHADHDGKGIHPGVPLVAQKTGYSEREVFRIIKELVSTNRLAVQEALPGKKVVYCLADPCQSVMGNPCQSDTPDKVSPLTSDALTPDICDSGPLTYDAIPPHPPIRKNRQEEPSKNRPIGGEKRFVRPTIEQCREYGPSINLPVAECDKFFHYQTSKGWKVGKEPMANWKSAMVSWRDSPFRKDKSPPKGGITDEVMAEAQRLREAGGLYAR